MIDFRDRPWHIGWERNRNSSQGPGDGPREQEDKATVQTDQDGPKISGTNPESKGRTPPRSAQSIPKSKTKKAIAVAIILAVFVFGGYSLRNNKSAILIPTGPQSCMFWAGDQYQQISCTQHHGDALIVAFDSVKLNDFKKITNPDTITIAAKGSVWYVKYRGEYEFYTSDGVHPIDPQLRLKPITAYILAHHVHPNLQSGVDQ
jgi:hypothetical protein